LRSVTDPSDDTVLARFAESFCLVSRLTTDDDEVDVFLAEEVTTADDLAEEVTAVDDQAEAVTAVDDLEEAVTAVDDAFLTEDVFVTVFSVTRPAPSRTTRVFVEISRPPLDLFGFATLVVLTGTGGGPGLLLEDEEEEPFSLDFREGIGLVLAVTDVVRGLVFGFVPE